MRSLLQVLGAAVLWGAGTALGEVPPYAISYHAAKAGIKNAEVEAMLGTSNGGKPGGGGGSSEGAKGDHRMGFGGDWRAGWMR